LVMRYAKTLEEIMNEYYLIPKDQARELFKEAAEQVSEEMNIGIYDEELTADSNIRTVEIIQEKVRKSF